MEMLRQSPVSEIAILILHLLDWGFRLTATAPVCLKSVEVVYAKLDSKVSRADCQQALALHNNDVQATEEYLRGGILMKKKNEELDCSATSICGLYSQTTDNGTSYDSSSSITIQVQLT